MATEANLKKPTRSKTTAKPAAQPKRTERKRVDHDTIVVMSNNTPGLFTYDCPKTKNHYELYGYGDTCDMTVGELKTMFSSHRTILLKYWILPVDVLDDEITLEDVIQYLQLDRHYGQDALIGEGELDSFILRVTPKQFNEKIEKMDEYMQMAIITRAVDLFRSGEFDDYNKMETIKRVSKREHIFEDAKVE
jgi:hypothetical protein